MMIYALGSTHERGSAIPLSKIHSRKNIEPFHASRKISKLLSRSRKNQGDHVSREKMLEMRIMNHE